MKVLDLPTGRVSLEFATAERDDLFTRLRGLGLDQVRYATHDVVTIRGQSFVYIDEWDEPCLISTSAIGDALLRQIGGEGAAYARNA